MMDGRGWESSTDRGRLQGEIRVGKSRSSAYGNLQSAPVHLPWSLNDSLCEDRALSSNQSASAVRQGAIFPRLSYPPEVHTRCDLRYRRRSKSAMRQSTTCGNGESRYMASVSGFIGRRCSICSISALCFRRVQNRRSKTRHLLVTFSCRMSSSLTTLSMSFLLSSSITSTFHYRKRAALSSGRQSSSGAQALKNIEPLLLQSAGLYREELQSQRDQGRSLRYS